MTSGDKDILDAARSLRLSTIDTLSEYLRRNKKSLERRLPKLVSAKVLFRNRWASTEPFIYSVKDLSRRSPFTISHELMITTIHTALHKTGLLIDWRQGKEHWRDMVHQDAFCTLEQGKKYDFYIEADNASMNSKDMEAKIKYYLAHFDSVQVPFRVLFVTTTVSRAGNLSKLAEGLISEKKRKLYLFTTIDKFKADPIGEICLIPYEDILYSILPRAV